jgi:hypothetical protein
MSPCSLTPCADNCIGELVGGESGQRLVGAELALEAMEGLLTRGAVGALT